MIQLIMFSGFCICYLLFFLKGSQRAETTFFLLLFFVCLFIYKALAMVLEQSNNQVYYVDPQKKNNYIGNTFKVTL